MWLAELGRQKVDGVFDSSKGIDEMIDFYLRKENFIDNMSRIEILLTNLG